MPPTPLATVTCHATPSGGGSFHVKLVVTSHTHHNPDAQKRCAAITGVYLTQLQPGTHTVSNVTITDHYGVNHTRLWAQASGVDEGFEGYVEGDVGGNLKWLAHTGIYDTASLHDTAVDARRLQTYNSAGTKLAAFNYLTGPVTFEFDITLAAAPTAVRLTIGLNGGNGGNPANHNPAFPNETLIIPI